jgi:hypothetical protein
MGLKAIARIRAVLAVAPAALLALGLVAAPVATLQAQTQDGGKRRAITVEQIEELAFGRLINSTNIPGETVIEAATGRKILRGGMADLSSTHARAQFLVRGEPKARVVINLPQELPLQGKGGATVILNDFTSSPSETGMLGSDGTLIVYVGATLEVKGGRPQGKYRADLDIFVDYQ